MTTKKHCDGCVLSGHWEGYDCGFKPRFQAGNGFYCGLHISIAVHNPARFETARKWKYDRNRARLSIVK